MRASFCKKDFGKFSQEILDFVIVNLGCVLLEGSKNLIRHWNVLFIAVAKLLRFSRRNQANCFRSDSVLLLNEAKKFMCSFWTDYVIVRTGSSLVFAPKWRERRRGRFLSRFVVSYWNLIYCRFWFIAVTFKVCWDSYLKKGRNFLQTWSLLGRPNEYVFFFLLRFHVFVESKKQSKSLIRFKRSHPRLVFLHCNFLQNISDNS